MDKQTLDKILELLKSHDYEMQALAKAIFILNEPKQEDYLYLDAMTDAKESFPEKYIDELGRKLRPRVTSTDNALSVMITSTLSIGRISVSSLSATLANMVSVCCSH